ncbi:MAG: hypothetical protein J6V87_03715 [Prevotella sp.]|nr:hypothetical protein [Prevotella sp.]
MTTEIIKRIVDDERAEQLTAQLCHHWEVVTQRLDTLAQEVTSGMDTCIEAEIYAAQMRMQRTVMALMELNKIPTAFLFSEYLERINKTVSNTSIRQSVMTLVQRLLGGTSPTKQAASFFDMVIQTMTQHVALPTEQQEVIRQQVSSQYIFSVCAQHLNPEDLMMVAQIIQNINTEGDAKEQEEITSQLQNMRQAMETLDRQMSESLQMMLIGLLLLMLLPGLLVSLMQQRRTDSKAKAQLFNKVLIQVRESNIWWEYWQERCETLRVVSDSSSWKEIMTAERTKERTELGKVPGGLFAKWTTDRKAFDEFFLDASLDDDALRHFIFHLATLSEIARELNPTTKFGDEQLVLDDLQRVGDAVLEAANRLSDLVTKSWFPHYNAMWQELIQNETIFAHLKVTRRSPHNNLFTARFFCHLVGEMKKSAVFGAHSDNDLAEKLTEKRYVGTFRKNIQEGMGEETGNVQKTFNAIYQKYKQLANTKR